MITLFTPKKRMIMNLKALFLLPILLLGTLVNSLPPTIKITTGDEKPFELKKEEYEHFKTLVDMLDDMDGMGTDIPVPLPNVSARCFKLLKKYIQKYIKACGDDAQKNSTRAQAIVSAELRELVMLEDLVELLEGANYLDCEILLEIVRQAIASGIHQNQLDVASAHRILPVAANLPAELQLAVTHALFIEDFNFMHQLHASYRLAHPEVSKIDFIAHIKRDLLIPQALVLLLTYNAHANGTKLVLHSKEDKVFIDALAELDIPFLNSIFTISQPTQDYTLIAVATFIFLKK